MPWLIRRCSFRGRGLLGHSPVQAELPAFYDPRAPQRARDDVREHAVRIELPAGTLLYTVP